MKDTIHYCKKKIKDNVSIFYHVAFHFGFLVFVTLIVAVISVIIYNTPPRRYTGSNIEWPDASYDPRNLTIFDSDAFDGMDKINVFMDPHSHSSFSDGTLSPEQLIKWHILQGYNVMCMTDHNTIKGGLEAVKIAQEKYSEKIVVIPGIEWTNCRCHLGLIGITKNVPLIKFPTNQQIKEIIDQVHQQGGLVIMNHHPWSTWAGLDQPSYQEWMDMGVDFIEVVNGNTFDYQGYLFAKKNNIRFLTGTDYHFNGRASAWTVFSVNSSSPIGPRDSISAKGLTQEMVMDALRSKSTQPSFLFDTTGSNLMLDRTLKVNPLYTFLSPWIYLGGFFHSYFQIDRGMYSFVDGSCTKEHINIYSHQILSLIAWMVILFLIFEIIYWLIRLLIHLVRGKFFKKSRKSKHDDNGDDVVNADTLDNITPNSPMIIPYCKKTVGDDGSSNSNSNPPPPPPPPYFPPQYMMSNAPMAPPPPPPLYPAYNYPK
ncbi:hypothetical protein CYY_000511 [Polysphondylium violaceum]|uniref:Polymerase/histidinol phosphatase N-terminal domain-containing protein n=1 Tax=Polysphondylium violaceum TaxID=133409 RepID=A0A8J4QAW0_9MYCE|nr:hypothetical protein CYY_000511 [Polysphondylium violaceum]